jgi:formate/nitrite transporter FocA (FNT family)
VIGRPPHEIWERSLKDGELRLARSTHVLAATSLLGGFHIMLGLLALVVTTGALAAVLPETTAHVLGSLTFGIAFVFLTIGRSELFTENFLIPVSTLLVGRGSLRSLARLWGVALVFNLAGIALFGGLLATAGVIEPEATEAAGELANTLADRTVLAAFLSAVLAGAVITVFTWLSEAAESDLTRLFVALLIGFLLLAPSTNHSVVGFGEILFGIFAETTDATWTDLVRNLAIAIAGNVVGGVGFVTTSRLVQAREAMAPLEDGNAEREEAG